MRNISFLPELVCPPPEQLLRGGLAEGGAKIVQHALFGWTKLPCIKLQPWKILPTPEQNPKNAPECQVDRYTERLSIIYEHTYIEGIGQILHFANY